MALLQSLNTCNQPTRVAVFGLGQIPHFTEGRRACRCVFAHQARKFNAGHVASTHVLNAQQLGVEHDDFGVIDLAVGTGFTLCQLF